ncbi:MAG: hypothetical protein U9O94_01990 [Nanoarchaeota archaeon]|nr:hypothetical protein [Nanoarchaeota archaeon]
MDESTEPKKQVLYEEDLGSKGKWGIYRDNGRVLFDYNCIFDASTGETESFHGQYPTVQFIEAMKQLQETGKATVTGDASQMDMKVNDRKRLDISFRYFGGSGMSISDVVCNPSRLAIR